MSVKRMDKGVLTECGGDRMVDLKLVALRTALANTPLALEGNFLPKKLLNQTESTMKNSNQHNNRTPWQSPDITTLSISHDTEQLGPPDPGQQS